MMFVRVKYSAGAELTHNVRQGLAGQAGHILFIANGYVYLYAKNIATKNIAIL